MSLALWLCLDKGGLLKISVTAGASTGQQGMLTGGCNLEQAEDLQDVLLG